MTQIQNVDGLVFLFFYNLSIKVRVKKDMLQKIEFSN